MQRRTFIAISAASTAATGAFVRPNWLGMARSAASESPGAPTGRLPRPTLARVEAVSVESGSDAACAGARLVPGSQNRNAQRLHQPMIRVTPLADVAQRVEAETGIEIALAHPALQGEQEGRRGVILYAARNSGAGCFPASSMMRAPLDGRGQISLLVTQRNAQQSQTTALPIGAAHAGTYLLAVPTALRGGRTQWRFSSARTDEAGQPQSVEHAVPGLSARCAYMCIELLEKPPEPNIEPTAAHTQEMTDGN